MQLCSGPSHLSFESSYAHLATQWEMNSSIHPEAELLTLVPAVNPEVVLWLASSPLRHDPGTIMLVQGPVPWPSIIPPKHPAGVTSAHELGNRPESADTIVVLMWILVPVKTLLTKVLEAFLFTQELGTHTPCNRYDKWRLKSRRVIWLQPAWPQYWMHSHQPEGLTE